ncbi:MAG: glycerol-3-phosphate acyltransferase [Evtepia sp.]
MQELAAIFHGVPFLHAFGISIAIALVAYLFGCMNGAVIVSKYFLRDDIRTHGSGNAGLTNFYRTFGGPFTFLVIAVDVLKMLIAVWLGLLIFSVLQIAPSVMVKYWAGLFCMLGHMFPCMFHFHGGKGILSGGTLVFLLDWKIAAVAWGVFLVVSAATRLVSLGSCCTAFTLPIMSALTYHSILVTIFSCCIGGLILWQHRGNIRRIFKGKESKFYFHRKKAQ